MRAGGRAADGAEVFFVLRGLEEPGGGSRTTTLKRHVPYARREGVEHNVVNANPFDFTFIEIEHLKG